MDLNGIGSDALRLIPTDNRCRIDLTGWRMRLRKTAKRASSLFC